MGSSVEVASLGMLIEGSPEDEELRVIDCKESQARFRMADSNA